MHTRSSFFKRFLQQHPDRKIAPEGERTEMTESASPEANVTVSEESVPHEELDGGLQGSRGRQGSPDSTTNVDATVAAAAFVSLPTTSTILLPSIQQTEHEIIVLSSGSETEENANDDDDNDDDDIVYCGMKKFSPKKARPDLSSRNSGQRTQQNFASTSMGNLQRKFPSVSDQRRPKYPQFIPNIDQESLTSYGVEAAYRNRMSVRVSEKSTSSFSSFAGVDFNTLRPPAALPQELTPSSSGNLHPLERISDDGKYALFKFGFSTADWDRHFLSADGHPTDWTTMSRKEIIAAATKSKQAKKILKALISSKKLQLTVAEKRHLRTLNLDLTPKGPESGKAIRLLRRVGLDLFQQPPLSATKKKKIRKKKMKKEDAAGGAIAGEKRSPFQEETEALPMLRPTDLRFQITPGFQQPSSSASTSAEKTLVSQGMGTMNQGLGTMNQGMGTFDQGILAAPPPIVEPKLLDHQIIKLTENSYWLLLTRKPIVVTGVARLQCFAGIVEIAGYQCKPGTQLVIPSLDCESWLSLYGDGDAVTVKEFEETATKSFDRMDVDRCVSTLKKFFGYFTAVALVTSTNFISDPVIWQSLKLFPKLLPELARDLADNSDRPLLWGQHCKLFPACRLIADDPLSDRKPYVPYLDFQKDLWKSVSRELDSLFDFPSPVILLCGGKNVGKSTTVRYAINYLLRKHPIVQCLDCDIGQSEFNPPGCLSMHTLTEPVFGPAFVRFRQPTVSCFLGEVSPSSVAENYRKSLEFVFAKGRRSDVPLVVNTMGWVEKLGLDLLKKISELTKPNLILELTQQENPIVSGQLFKNVDTRIVTLPSGAAFDSLKKAWTPAAKRKMGVSIYLSRISPNSRFRPDFGEISDFGFRSNFGFLNECVPFSISFSDVFLYFTEKIPPSHFLTVLLGAFVGLAQRESGDGNGDGNGNGDVDSSDSERIEAGPLFILPKFPICRNLGFGIVRSIDAEKKIFYVLTPVPEEELSRVNVLIRGSVTTPDEVFLNQNLRNYSGFVPKVQTKLDSSSSGRTRNCI